MNFPFLVLCLVILGNKDTLLDAASTTSRDNKMRNSIFNDLEDEDIPIFNYQNGDESRIVGGEQTTIEKFPHQVSFTTPTSRGDLFCGGFIISENYIMTAAHCCDDDSVPPANFVVRVGSSFRSNGTRIPIATKTRHPDYNRRNIDKDVCVLKTAEPIELNNVTIKAIKLPEVGRDILNGSRVNVSGWGKMRFNNPNLPEQLRSVNVPVVDRRLCKMTYPTLTENQFCIGNYNTGGKGTCQGDSGGAGVQDDMAIGIVSFGSRRCSEGPRTPSAEANIAAPAIRNFIKEQTGV